MRTKQSRELEKAQVNLETVANNHRAALETSTNAANATVEARETFEKRRAALTIAGLEGSNSDQRLAYLSSQLEPEANQLRTAETTERNARATLTNADNALMVARYRVRVWLALTESRYA